MTRWEFVTPAAVPLSILAYCQMPDASCSTEWRTLDGSTIEGPFDACKVKIDIRAVGDESFAQVGPSVYAVSYWRRDLPGEQVCMIGVTCFPVYRRARIDEGYVLWRLDGPAYLLRLKSYLDGHLLSDGSAVFQGKRRVEPLTPALELTRLRKPVPFYATEGGWVIHGGRVLEAADPASLRQTGAVRAAPGSVNEPISVVQDHRFVYKDHQRIDGADPETFELVYYDRGNVYPGAGAPVTGWLAFDAQRGWLLDRDSIQALPLSARQLQDVRDRQACWRARQQVPRTPASETAMP